MQQWSLEKLILDLKFDWTISRNSSQVKTNFIVKIKDDEVEGLGEIAFNIRYGESAELIEEGFSRFLEECQQEVTQVGHLIALLDRLDLPQSLRFGIESAFVHYLSNMSQMSPYEILNVPKGQSVNTSFSIPIMDIGKIGSFIEDHQINRFKSLKIKVNQDNAFDMLFECRQHFAGKIRIDANEAFRDPDAVLKLCEIIEDQPIEFLEQPLHADLHEEQKYLKSKCPFILIGDESITSGRVHQFYKERFDGVNIKLMKSGGYFNAIKQIKDAKEMGLLVMIGCMVESSLGINSAMQLSGLGDFFDLDGFLLIKGDPFRYVYEENGRIYSSQWQ